MVRVDEKYGVNPTITSCFFCGEDKDVLLVGKATQKMRASEACSNDGEMHMKIGVIDMEPCNKCKELMQQGIMVISTKDGESGNNPYRTGRIVVLKEEVISKMCPNEELVNNILDKRFTFMEDTVWEAVGLPV